ncbi:hypothetical protein ACUND2_22345 [Serratia sp. IR-2025]
MRILLSTADLISLVTKHAFTSLVPEAKAADVEVGIMNGEIVAAIAVGEDNFKLKSIKDLQEPLVSGSTPETDQEEASEEDENATEETSNETDGSKPKRRKRRTKTEIEADKAAEEAAAQAEAQAQEETDATETKAGTEAEVDPFAEPNEADDTPPFDVDEGAVKRAEAEKLPEAKTETEEVDPFADAGVATSEGDELFAQADTPVSKVVETSEAGFAKPADTEDDPFANFD